MFATLAGGYPWPPGPPPHEALADVLRARVEAGLGLLSDGLVHAAGTPPSSLVACWRAARDAGAALAPGLPVRISVGGPFAAGGTRGALEVAGGLREGLAALAGEGCPVVEVHEPATALPRDEEGREAFAAAHRALLDDVADAVHACLAVTGGDAVALGAEALFAAPYRSHLLDLLDGPESWRLVVATPGERGIVVAVGDASGHRRTRLEDAAWAATYAASTGGRGMERVGIAPSGSLAGLAEDRAREVLVLLGRAVRAIADGRGALLASLDPRAIDARSAALGRYRDPRDRPG